MVKESRDLVQNPTKTSRFSFMSWMLVSEPSGPINQHSFCLRSRITLIRLPPNRLSVVAHNVFSVALGALPLLDQENPFGFRLTSTMVSYCGVCGHAI